MAKIFNSTLDEKAGYVFNEDGDIAVVDKKTGESMQINFGPQEVLDDASKAYIKNDIYVPEVEVEVAKPEPEMEVECNCNGYCGDHNCICQSESCEECKEEVEVETAKPETDDRKVKEPIKTIEPEEVEVEDDIKHQLEAKDFGEYLIVIGDYAEKDFDVFVGTKAELNDHIAELHLHQTPKVYILKQLPVRTKYEVL